MGPRTKGGGGGGGAGGGNGGNGGSDRYAAGGAGGGTSNNPSPNGADGASGVDTGGLLSGGGGGGGGANGNGTGAASLPGTSLTGGNGGNGGNGSYGAGGGGGGAGGYGAIVTGTGMNLNEGIITGGYGGNGGAGGDQSAGGSGGDGGVGVRFTASGASLTNTGNILGGYGGAAGAAGMNGANVATAGLGGAGVVGRDLTVTATGSIVGGTGRGGRADALTFTGGNNVLDFTSVNGSVLLGGIGVSGHLALNGPDPFANIIHDGPNGAGALITGGTGTLTLTGANTYSGGTTIAAGSTLALDGAAVYNPDGSLGSAAAGTGAISFMSGTATGRLVLTTNAQVDGVTFANTIENFNAGSQLDLAGLTGASFVSYANGTLTITGTLSGRTVTEMYRFTNPTSTNFIVSDNAGGTRITLCFVAGTLIRTARGDVPVEGLVVGDLAVTAAGRRVPIAWLGHRAVDCRREPEANRPVRIAAHAFAPNRPARDLLLSPGHPVLVDADADNEGGHLVPIMCLINGTTVRRHAVDEVTYWHVELDAHDILLAEGLPAESYIDLGSRPWFAGAAGALYDPDMVAPGMPGRCRPVAVDGPVVEAERRRLDAVLATRLAAACAWPDLREARLA